MFIFIRRRCATDSNLQFSLLSRACACACVSRLLPVDNFLFDVKIPKTENISKSTPSPSATTSELKKKNKIEAKRKIAKRFPSVVAISLNRNGNHQFLFFAQPRSVKIQKNNYIFAFIRRIFFFCFFGLEFLFFGWHRNNHLDANIRSHIRLRFDAIHRNRQTQPISSVSTTLIIYRQNKKTRNRFARDAQWR